MIKAVDYIKTAFSADDAEKLDKVIMPLIDGNEKITVDFSKIAIFTTLFFNNVFAKHILKMGIDGYNSKFELINLSELGKTTYNHSYNNAVNYYKLSSPEKEVRETILRDFES